MYVKTKSGESRQLLVDYLENEGFVCIVDEVTNKEIILSSKYPIKVDIENKTYSILHSTTAAAAATSSGLVISEEEFYRMRK